MGRFLLIGLDGAEPELVERWIAEGALPNLARLRNRGTLMPVASTAPPATFPAWTTCVTGVNPGKHGILDFTEMIPGKYAVRFVNSTYRKAPAIWNVVSDAGGRVCVLVVPATYPPERLNGCMVSGFDSPVTTRVDRSFVYPPARYPAVRAWRFADFQESHIHSGWHAQALRRLLDAIEVKESIAARMLESEPWTFFMAVFGESDTVAHHFWLFHDAHSPRHRPGFEDAIRRVYCRLDQAVGRLVEAAGPAVTVAVVSDHGFGGTGTGVVHLNNWLAGQGLLRFAGPSGSVLKRLALRYMPAAWQGVLFRRFHGVAMRAENRSRFAGIDWAHTKAWSEELNYFPSIRVNLAGREPRGQVEPAGYASFVVKLCAALETWPPVRKAWRRDELYSGDYVSRAPDIILELALENGYAHSCLRRRSGPAFRRIGPDEYLGGKERGMNGSHRPNGVLILSEPTNAKRARLEDVAPTVLNALGVPGPPMDGHPLLGGPRAHRPSAASHPREQRYGQEEERAVERQLRGLGYFE